MQSELELKRVAREHLSAVVALDLLCFGGLWTLAGYERELDSPNSDLLGLFVQSKLIAIGCFWEILEEAHITILAVHPNYQHQGLGQALLIAMLMAARWRGLERATLEVRASNEAALSLYHKFGFKIAGQRRRYYPDTGEDALILWQAGLNHPEFAQTLATWEQEVCDRLLSTGWNCTSLREPGRFLV